MADDKAKHRLPRRGYLGFVVDAKPAPPELIHEGLERWIVSEIDSSSSFGVFAEVTSRTDELREVLALGDDLVALNGSPIHSLADLRSHAASIAPGEIVRITILRKGEAVEIFRRSLPMPLESLRAGTVHLDEVPWRFREGEHRLRAIWTKPDGAIKSAVWLLPSAAWVTQECSLDSEDPTFQLIDFLTESGIATLRIDRSGLGDSEGPQVSELDFDAEISMWSAGIRYFLEKMQGTRCCLFGRSLGGILAPLVARGHFVDAICVLGASSLPWHEAMLESVEHQHRVRQDSEDKIRRSLEKIERLQRAVYGEGLTPSEARKNQPDLADVLATDFMGERVYDRDARFFQQLAQVDVPAAWSEFQGELLALHSEYDIIVPERAVKRLAQVAGGPGQFRSLLGVDHFMHERRSLDEAVRVPWGGNFSLETARTIRQFLLGNQSFNV